MQCQGGAYRGAAGQHEGGLGLDQLAGVGQGLEVRGQLLAEAGRHVVLVLDVHGDALQRGALLQRAHRLKHQVLQLLLVLLLVAAAAAAAAAAAVRRVRRVRARALLLHARVSPQFPTPGGETRPARRLPGRAAWWKGAPWARRRPASPWRAQRSEPQRRRRSRPTGACCATCPARRAGGIMRLSASAGASLAARGGCRVCCAPSGPRSTVRTEQRPARRPSG